MTSSILWRHNDVIMKKIFFPKVFNKFYNWSKFGAKSDSRTVILDGGAESAPSCDIASQNYPWQIGLSNYFWIYNINLND